MNFGFVTCVKLGLSCMEQLYKQGIDLKLAITLPDSMATKKSGRVYIDEFCTSKSITLLKISNINNLEVIETIKKFNIDWLFIIGWSQINIPDTYLRCLKITSEMFGLNTNKLGA